MKRFLMALLIGMLTSGLCYGAKKKHRHKPPVAVAASEIPATSLCEQDNDALMKVAEVSQPRPAVHRRRRPPKATPIMMPKSEQESNCLAEGPNGECVQYKQ